MRAKDFLEGAQDPERLGKGLVRGAAPIRTQGLPRPGAANAQEAPGNFPKTQPQALVFLNGGSGSPIQYMVVPTI